MSVDPFVLSHLPPQMRTWIQLFHQFDVSVGGSLDQWQSRINIAQTVSRVIVELK